jgi:hypothetical protein
MPIRLARVTDEPAIASLCTAAFWDEDLFGRVIHPRRNEFPDDVKIFWHEWIRADWRDKGKIIIVAVRNEEKQEVHSGSTQREADGQDGTQGEKIVGVAVWQRKGNDEEAQRVKNDWKDPGKQIRNFLVCSVVNIHLTLFKCMRVFPNDYKYKIDYRYMRTNRPQDLMHSCLSYQRTTGRWILPQPISSLSPNHTARFNFKVPAPIIGICISAALTQPISNAELVVNL